MRELKLGYLRGREKGDYNWPIIHEGYLLRCCCSATISYSDWIPHGNVCHKQPHFESLFCKEVIPDFEGGRITSDPGGLVLRELDQRYRVDEKGAECLHDPRDSSKVKHDLADGEGDGLLTSYSGMGVLATGMAKRLDKRNQLEADIETL